MRATTAPIRANRPLAKRISRMARYMVSFSWRLWRCFQPSLRRGSGASAARLDRRHRADGPRSTKRLIPPGTGRFPQEPRPAGTTLKAWRATPATRSTTAQDTRARPHAGAGAHRGGRHSARPSGEPSRRLRGAAPGGAGPAPGRRNHGRGLDHPAAGRCCSPPSTSWAPSWRSGTPPAGPGSIRGPTRPVAGRRLPPLAAAGLGQRRLRLAGLPAVLPAVHVLRRRLALPAIALSTVFVIAALWFHNGGSRPMRPASCPWCSGPRSAQPSLWSRGWPTGRCTWRRKTSGWRPRSSAAPVPNSPGPSTTPAPWPSAPGWPAKSTTPSPRACPASC